VISLLVGLLPEAAVAPILIFIGLEITAQAFVASPAKHAPAVAVAFIPVIANLLLIQVGGFFANLGRTAVELTGEAEAAHRALLTLGNGFILSSLLWGSAVVFIIDRRLRVAAAVFACASLAALFGLIHSPLPSGGLLWPWSVDTAPPALLAGSYGVVAGILWWLGAKRDSS
jgi:AGZA family xanthine/uracil permease-like MFS transporter